MRFCDLVVLLRGQALLGLVHFLFISEIIMGLDQYAYSISNRVAGTKQVDIEMPPRTKKKELAFWRKFNHLHGWMQSLYYDKKGLDNQFNCASVRLMPADLDALEKALIANTLQHTPGFFFGSAEIYPEDVKNTLEFITEARVAIKEGRAVIYDSWW